MKSVRGLESIDGVLVDGLDFCKFAYQTLESIHSESGGTAELRLLKSQRAKKLLEEILPVAAFVKDRYSPGVTIRVRWRGGNQRYDARLLFSGATVDAYGIPAVQHLEVTSAVHENDYLAREHLHREGGSFGARGTTRDSVTKRTVSVPVLRRHLDNEHELVGMVRRRIESKSQLPYPRNTTLVVRFVAPSLVLQDEWDRAVQWLSAEPHPPGFVEVVLVEGGGNRISTISRKPKRNARANRRLQPTARDGILSAPRLNRER
jgi:hypothetical protein